MAHSNAETVARGRPGRTRYRLPPRQVAAPTQGAEKLFYGELLESHLCWFCRLRWLAVAGYLALWLVGRTPYVSRLGLTEIGAWPLVVGLLLGACNGVYLWLNAVGDNGARFRIMLWQIVTDLLLLTVTVHYLGSVHGFFPALYMFHIVLACIFLPSAWSALVTALSIGLYGGLAVLETAGLLAPKSLFQAHVEENPWAAHLLSSWWQVAMALFSFAVIWYLTVHLAARLRARELEWLTAHAQLEAALEERGRYLRTTTHELKAPLAAIQANTQVLLKGYLGELPAPAVEAVEKIQRRSRRMTQAVKELLLLSHLRSKLSERPEPEACDLAALLEECLRQAKPNAEKQQVQLASELEPVTVETIRDYLKMVLDNLLMNAIHYSHAKGTVTLTLAREAQGAARIRVEDQGIGIPEEHLPHIFKEYYNTKEARAHNPESTGLGLAIVAQLAETLGLVVEVESAPEQGTAFTVVVPPARPRHVTAQETAKETTDA